MTEITDPAVHIGDQPIRALYPYISEFSNPENKFIYEFIKQHGINPLIQYRLEKEPLTAINENGKCFMTPFILNNAIYIRETFLSYLWTLTYAPVVLHNELQGLVKKGVAVDQDKWDSALALRVASYGKSLICKYSDWDKSDPNPELYKPKDKKYIEMTNCVYFWAFHFILNHEIGHAVKKHENPSISIEEEADNFSFETLLNLRDRIPDHGTKDAVIFGIISGIFSLIILSPLNEEYKETSHPNPFKRLSAFMNKIEKRLKLDENNEYWLFALLTLEMANKISNDIIEWKVITESTDSNKIQFLKAIDFLIKYQSDIRKENELKNN